MRPLRWFSSIKTIGPWLMPRWNGDTHKRERPDLSAMVALNVALKP